MTFVLADMDGVLVDSYAAVLRCWRWWGDLRGLPRERVDALPHGRPTREVCAVLAPHLDPDEEAAIVERREVEDVEGVVALPGAAGLFERFGDGRLAVVTSAGISLARARLAAAGLPEPAVLVTPERLTGSGKPDPEPYLLAAGELGADPAACVVLEDAPAGVAAGRAAGAHVVGVLTTHTPAELTGAHALVADVAAWLDGAARA